MDPALMYFGMLGFCLVVLVLGWIHKRPATRECPLCESRVELGKIFASSAATGSRPRGTEPEG